MRRFIFYIIGLNLIAAAVVLNIRYNLGVAAFGAVSAKTPCGIVTCEQ